MMCEPGTQTKLLNHMVRRRSSCDLCIQEETIAEEEEEEEEEERGGGGDGAVESGNCGHRGNSRGEAIPCKTGAILQTFSSLKRSDEELALADAQASIKSNILMGITKVPSRKRTLAVANEDNGRVDFPCPQCVPPKLPLPPLLSPSQQSTDTPLPPSVAAIPLPPLYSFRPPCSHPLQQSSGCLSPLTTIPAPPLQKKQKQGVEKAMLKVLNHEPKGGSRSSCETNEDCRNCRAFGPKKMRGLCMNVKEGIKALK
ncbi:hypothetical protein KSP40_PGU008720 [Platanthera guangdongensis]|uniref:Uncharacterized protein n=1 Tax=Platanthera guangdongensis TaxID=2320717 RepID=A0ABR2MQU3_9ASPA